MAVIDPQEAMLAAAGPQAVRRQAGSRGAVVIHCPFHQETTPSCYLYPERGGYHCFGCGENGTPEDFLRRTMFAHLSEREGFIAAYAYLESSQSGGPRALPRTPFESWRESARKEAERAKERALTDPQRDALTRFIVLCYEALRPPAHVTVRSYAETRGLLDEQGRPRYLTGYCAGTGLHAALAREPHLVRAACEIGLLRQVDVEGQAYAEPFRGRLILVDRNEHGRGRFITGRAVPGLVPDETLQRRKYLHLSGPKVLFGQHATPQAERVIVVEGPLCQIALRTLGYTAVALLGKTLPGDSAGYFTGKTVVPCLDAPRTREEATSLYLAYEKLRDALAPYAKEIEDPIDLSDTGCIDPSDYIQKYGCFQI